MATQSNPLAPTRYVVAFVEQPQFAPEPLVFYKQGGLFGDAIQPRMVTVTALEKARNFDSAVSAEILAALIGATVLTVRNAESMVNDYRKVARNRASGETYDNP